jgi:aminoglycoside phosphotransferase (APT) family kinase protein
MRALSRTAVPVPAVAWYEADAAVLGAPFFVMSRVQGETPPLFWYGGSTSRVRAAAAALAAIHAVDWRAAGLAFLLPTDASAASPPSPIACELAAWRPRVLAMGVEDDGLVVALERYLRDHEPEDARLGLIHGDTNAGNYLFRGHEVVAVVDWEISALGDPRSDLGFYAALAGMFGGWRSEAGESVLSAAYEEVTAAPLQHLSYYEALGLYRMLIVMAGWAGRGFGFYGRDAVAHRLAELLGPRWAA